MYLALSVTPTSEVQVLSSSQAGWQVGLAADLPVKFQLGSRSTASFRDAATVAHCKCAARYISAALPPLDGTDRSSPLSGSLGLLPDPEGR